MYGKVEENSLYYSRIASDGGDDNAYAVPKANEDEISMRIRVFIDLALALLISLAILIKGNRGKRKSVVRLFVICVIPYLQIGYTSAFY